MSVIWSPLISPYERFWGNRTRHDLVLYCGMHEAISKLTFCLPFLSSLWTDFCVERRYQNLSRCGFHSRQQLRSVNRWTDLLISSLWLVRATRQVVRLWSDWECPESEYNLRPQVSSTPDSAQERPRRLEGSTRREARQKGNRRKNKSGTWRNEHRGSL